jgi:hypothetical protein
MRKYFRIDDDDGASYWIVALDQADAGRRLAGSGIEFGQDSKSFETAMEQKLLTLTELTEEQAQRLKCETEDDRGKISLFEADLGEWFCSEW